MKVIKDIELLKKFESLGFIILDNRDKSKVLVSIAKFWVYDSNTYYIKLHAGCINEIVHLME